MKGICNLRWRQVFNSAPARKFGAGLGSAWGQEEVSNSRQRALQSKASVQRLLSSNLDSPLEMIPSDFAATPTADPEELVASSRSRE